LIDEKVIIEVGGSIKRYEANKNLENAYLAIDNIESGYKNVIPLWLFGFLY